MRRCGMALTLLAAVVCFARQTPAQTVDAGTSCPAAMAGAWTATLDLDRLFDLHVQVRDTGPDGGMVARFATESGSEEVPAWRDGDRFRFQPSSRPVGFDLRWSGTNDDLHGFARFAGYLFHVVLPRHGDGSWAARWSPVGSGHGEQRLDLYFDEEGGRATGGYLFFRNAALPSLFGEGVTCEEDRMSLRERNLGIELSGETAGVGTDTLWLEVSALGGETRAVFLRMAGDQVPETPDAPLATPRKRDAGHGPVVAPPAVEDGWPVARPSEAGLAPARLARLVDAVARGDLTNVHSIVVARGGRLVLEEYFYGYDRETAHDLRSASKTLASTLTGLAVRDGRLAGDTVRVLPLFPYRIYDNWDSRKARISIRDVLTMSSGLDANDADRGSIAAEDAYQWQWNPDWVKVALDAPMVADPGSQPVYGSANPMILGAALSAVLEQPLEWYAHEALFEPLDIRDYRWATMPTGDPYLGGGMHLRPRDLLKIGQLYLDGGTWRGERILPKSWVDASWGRYGRLAPLDVNGHEYGYLWWHDEIAGTSGGAEAAVGSVQARGYGGQYLFVVPDLELVVVVTAGNYRNRRTRQSEEILRDWILPALHRD